VEDICASKTNKNKKIMAIQIQYDGGVYEIEGLLNAQNCESLKIHIETLIDHSRGIVLSLNKVLDIDRNSVTIIASLQKTAQLRNKMFFIIGMKNKKVNELFTTLNLNNILL
jgi:anti-anti-sigma regulatory factor